MKNEDPSEESILGFLILAALVCIPVSIGYIAGEAWGWLTFGLMCLLMAIGALRTRRKK